MRLPIELGERERERQRASTMEVSRRPEDVAVHTRVQIARPGTAISHHQMELKFGLF